MYYNESPGRTFKSVKRKWRSISETQFSCFKKQVANGGTKYYKLQQVDATVMATFTETRSKMLPVHDLDLAKWAIEAANKIGLQFLASKKWISNFKRRHELVSRKVTKVQSSSKMAAAAQILEAADTFRNKVLTETPKYSPQLVFSIDQSGFQYEFYSTHTLSFKGERHTDRYQIDE